MTLLERKFARVDNIGSHNPQRQINRIKRDEINFKTKIKITGKFL